jgi:hypothetical protein
MLRVALQLFSMSQDRTTSTQDIAYIVPFRIDRCAMQVCFFLVGVCFTVSACARPEALNMPPASMPSSAPLIIITPAHAAMPVTTPTSPVSSAPPKKEIAALCATNADCSWNDACLPTRCVSAKGSSGLSACEKSLPKSGECLCLESYCTLKPKRLPEPVVLGCKADLDCGFEASSGTCAKVERGQNTTGSPIKQEGAFCSCEPKAGACRVEWVGPIACKTYKDCSWTRSPLRPVPSSLIPRPNPKPVKACSTGEVDSVCKESICVMLGWSC